ncbi:MAG TPA: KilA-N domain-containing protein [Nitrosarchaeum sp.]|nr:KilA-N domain-containing protein [Nitrosarchaeum sp.]
MSLTEIIFEYVSDEKEYARGKYGDFEVIMNKDGYVNATKLCSSEEKRFKKWLENKSSKELINEVEKNLMARKRAINIIKIGGKIGTQISGTYVHPLLIPHIASWISPKFAVKVSQIVNEYIINEAVKEKKEKIRKQKGKIMNLEEQVALLVVNSEKVIAQNDKLLTKNKKMSKKIDNLTNQNDELLEKNDVMIDKLDDVCNDRVVRPKSKGDVHSLIIVKTTENKLMYHAIRRLRKDADNAVSRYMSAHEDSEVVLHINYTPNAINLFSRVKDRLSEEKKIKYKGNDIKLRGKYTEDEFIEEMRSIHNERFEH